MPDDLDISQFMNTPCVAEPYTPHADGDLDVSRLINRATIAENEEAFKILHEALRGVAPAFMERLYDDLIPIDAWDLPFIPASGIPAEYSKLLWYMGFIQERYDDTIVYCDLNSSSLHRDGAPWLALIETSFPGSCGPRLSKSLFRGFTSGGWHQWQCLAFPSYTV